MRLCTRDLDLKKCLHTYFFLLFSIPKCKCTFFTYHKKTVCCYMLGYGIDMAIWMTWILAHKPSTINLPHIKKKISIFISITKMLFSWENKNRIYIIFYICVWMAQYKQTYLTIYIPNKMKTSLHIQGQTRQGTLYTYYVHTEDNITSYRLFYFHYK